MPCKAALRGSQSHIWASGGRLGTPHFVSSSLYLKSLQFDKEQMAALTEANEVLKKQIEELQQEAARYAGAGCVLAGRWAVAVSLAGPPALSVQPLPVYNRWPRKSESTFKAGKVIPS